MDDKETKLSDQQLARVEALKEARNVLASKSGFSMSAVEPTDLHSIAQYIIDGKDPWPEPEQPVNKLKIYNDAKTELENI